MHLKTLPKNFPANGRQHFPKIASRISGGKILSHKNQSTRFELHIKMSFVSLLAGR